MSQAADFTDEAPYSNHSASKTADSHDDYSDAEMFHTVIRLIEGTLSQSEIDNLCAQLASDCDFRQSYGRCIDTIAELHFYAWD